MNAAETYRARLAPSDRRCEWKHPRTCGAYAAVCTPDGRLLCGAHAPRRAEPVLEPDAIYIGDAGHVFCGRHAGMTARYTGRDISGQPVLPVTEIPCEVCQPD